LPDHRDSFLLTFGVKSAPANTVFTCLLAEVPQPKNTHTLITIKRKLTDPVYTENMTFSCEHRGELKLFYLLAGPPISITVIASCSMNASNISYATPEKNLRFAIERVISFITVSRPVLCNY
jgi:hypothetical protein